MTKPRKGARRKLLILGDAALLERITQAGLDACDLVLASSEADARQALQAHPDLTLVLASAARGAGGLAGIHGRAPHLRAILLSKDRALVRASASLELGAVQRILVEDASPAALREAIHEAFERIAARLEPGPGPGTAADAGAVHDAAAPWLGAAPGPGIRLREDWVRVLAHDLRTPLGINNSFAGLLLDEAHRLHPEAQELLRRMKSNEEWMLEFVDGILELSALQQGQAVLAYEPVSLGTLLRGVAERLRGLAEPKGVRIEAAAPRDARRYAVDRVRVEQVLHNLIANAVSASPPGRVVRISARAGQGKLTFEVRDEGPGMTPEEAAAVFVRFAPQRGGRGLGLAIAKEIATLHGGRIWLESRPGHGCTFRFTIVPGHSRNAGHGPPRSNRPPGGPGEERSLGTRRSRSRSAE
jgi:signal transduction histidine kinase